MDDRELNKLIKQDEQLDPSNAADGTDANVEADTKSDEGLRLLHRVRQLWSDWPLGDPQLDEASSDDELQWGSNGPPKSLGRFQIREELGRGGFGIVLLAHDPTLQQDVALKIPRAESMISPEARERMTREARAATILAHPAIVPVYDVGNFGAVTYIAYDYCSGDSLADWIGKHRGKIGVGMAANIVARLAEAMQHAHARKIIHRDLKPGNILLDHEASEGGGNDETLIEALRIADFGLAKFDVMRSDISRTGTPLGTPAYMSPEQARGDANVTATSDIFSLGIILYELLTGQVPFRRDNDIATLRAIESDPHLSIRSQTKLVPKDLAGICDKCLEKSPQDRYESAQSLHDDLTRFLNDEPVMARPVGRTVRFVRWCRRNPALAATLSALMLVLLASTAISLTLLQHEQAARQQAEANADEAHQQAKRIRVVINELLTELTQQPAVDTEGVQEFRKKLLASFYKQIREEDSQDPQIQQEFLKTIEDLATIHRMMGDHKQAAELWRDAIKYVDLNRPDDGQKRAYFMSLLAGDLAMFGNVAESNQLARDALEIQRLVMIENPENPHLCSNMVGQLANLAETIATQSPAEADALIDEAIELGTQILGKPPENWPPVRLWNCILVDKAKTTMLLGKELEAQKFSGLALQHIEQRIENAPQDRSYCLNQLQAVHSTLGQLYQSSNSSEKAAEHFQKAYDHMTSLVERHADVGVLVCTLPHKANALAGALIELQNIDAARPLLEANWERIALGRTRFPGCEKEWTLGEEELNRLWKLLELVVDSP